MKLTASSVFLAIFCISLRAYGQSSVPRISITLKNVPLRTALDSIEFMTGYTDFGETSWTKVAHNVSIVVKDVPIDEALKICFKGQPLVYSLVGQTISIRLKKLQDVSAGGRLINSRREAIAGATIQVKGTKTFVQSNDNGEFSIPIEGTSATVVIGSVNYERIELTLGVGMDTVVRLKERVIALSGISVMHTGYQNIPRERSTGSFAFIDNNLVNRNPSPNILQRLDGVTSSLLFTKNAVINTNQSSFSIRGRSTIFANPEPLIVLDNFPYTGDIYNINPDDVDNVTVLKDAAAASIWGAFSGNGVVVITTKKGKFNQAPKVCFNTSITTSGKPNLYYTPILAPSELAGLEQSLFNSGFYNNIAADPSHPPLPPVAEILFAQQDGSMTPAEASNQINILKGQDSRRDLDKYFYQHRLTQQYSVSVSGGGAANQYYLSAGYDKDITNLVRNQYDRVTLTGNSTHILIPKKLELSTGFNYAASRNSDNNPAIAGVNYSYEPLADSHGNALAVPAQYRQSFIDTVGGGHLLDWQYRPLGELRNADNTTRLSDYRINVGLKYNIWQNLSANIYYQYWKASSDLQNFYGNATYYEHNLVNTFTQLNGGVATRPIPDGGIMDETDSSYQANNARIQLNYDHYFTPDQSFTAIAGMEVRDIEGSVKTTRLYGYDKDLSGSLPVNANIPYPTFLFPYTPEQIPYPNHYLTTSDRFLSYYFNGSYHFGRYILSASLRKDESNIFGVNANRKGIPLWSAGAVWEVSREAFYHADKWLPYLKLRLTDGYNGNVDKTVSAYTTAMIDQYTSTYGATTASIVNPPNPNLQWEKIHIINGGIDFATRKSRLEGSLEYYVKFGEDLIAPAMLDPTTGNPSFTGNTAAMVTRGLDVTLRFNSRLGPVKWTSILLGTYNRDKVTTYGIVRSNINDYVNSGFLSPFTGYPLYSIYALKWMGLDPQNGNPQGLLNGKVSEDYYNITNSSSLSDLMYMGSSTPTVFGSIRNTFFWRALELSFNILYKGGYYFRKPSINYSNLYSGVSAGNLDYDKRWMKPGDEKITNVPSAPPQVYPVDQSRDQFYTSSSVLVEKGDNLRLQDVRLSYGLNKKTFRRVPLQWAQVYFYVNNVGILWKANHQGIDPDAIPGITGYPVPRAITVGIKLGF